MTAGILDSDRKRRRDCGMDGVLSKPIERDHSRRVPGDIRRARALARLSYNLQ